MESADAKKRLADGLVASNGTQHDAEDVDAQDAQPQSCSRAGSLGCPSGYSVYVGSSVSDLPALLSVDLGIILGQAALLKRMAAAARVALLPLLTGNSCCNLTS